MCSHSAGFSLTVEVLHNLANTLLQCGKSVRSRCMHWPCVHLPCTRSNYCCIKFGPKFLHHATAMEEIIDAIVAALNISEMGMCTMMGEKKKFTLAASTAADLRCRWGPKQECFSSITSVWNWEHIVPQAASVVQILSRQCHFYLQTVAKHLKKKSISIFTAMLL